MFPSHYPTHNEKTGHPHPSYESKCICYSTCNQYHISPLLYRQGPLYKLLSQTPYHISTCHLTACLLMQMQILQEELQQHQSRTHKTRQLLYHIYLVPHSTTHCYQGPHRGCSQAKWGRSPLLRWRTRSGQCRLRSPVPPRRRTKLKIY